MRRLATGDGERYANAKPAEIPPELTGVIAGVVGLDNLSPAPQTVHSSLSTAQADGIGPADLANAYGLGGLHARGLLGAGITIAVAGRTPVGEADVQTYRSEFGISQNDFQSVAVPHSAGTGAVADEQEGTFDLEILAGVAPAASLLYVWGSTVDTAAEWVIDNRLATILSESYAGCENSGDVLYQTLAMQAAAEGITWISAAGDSGAAGCDTPGAEAAANGLRTTAPASTPGIVAVGGTTLTATTETAWSSSQTVEAGGGGASAVFGMPGYQSDFALTPDNGRMLPDVAFAASPQISPYALIFQGQPLLAGGTSLAAPLFAGMVALVNESLSANGALAPGLGAINPILYRLREIRPGVFHDITTGSNDVPCAVASVDCASGLLGYPALSGYDLATGLGSVDGTALADNWAAATFETAELTLSPGSSAGQAGQPAQVNALVTSDGLPLAQSPVQFYLTNAVWQPNQVLLATVATDANGIARFETDALPSGENTIEAIATGTTSVSQAPPAVATIQTAGIASGVAVTAPQGTVAIDQSVDLAVRVTAAAGASLSGPADGLSCPMGTVTLYGTDGSIQGEPVPVDSSGMASLVTSPLGAGTNSFNVGYSGNCYIAPSHSAEFSLGPAVNPPDFALSGPPSVALLASGTATVSMTIQPVNGFDGTVKLTCSASSPSAICLVPNQLDVSGSTVIPVTISACLNNLQSTGLYAAFICLFIPRRRRRQLFRRLAIAMVLLAFTSCGRESPSSQSVPGFDVTVTASSGAIAHSAVVHVTEGQ